MLRSVICSLFAFTLLSPYALADDASKSKKHMTDAEIEAFVNSLPNMDLVAAFVAAGVDSTERAKEREDHCDSVHFAAKTAFRELSEEPRMNQTPVPKGEIHEAVKDALRKELYAAQQDAEASGGQ